VIEAPSIQAREFEFRGTTYSVLFDARGRYVFETLAGYPVSNLRAWTGTISDHEITHLLVAGLEGHRVRAKGRAKPWTVEDVLAMFGDGTADEVGAIAKVCVGAVNAAFTGITGQKEPGEGKAPTEN
jgi:hypothetical protein